MDARRALPGSAHMESRRSYRRCASDRRPQGNRGHRRIHRDRGAFQIAPYVPSRRARARGLKGKGRRSMKIKWPESIEPALYSVGLTPTLTPAARRLAEGALAEIERAGVVVTLDEEGRAHFRATKPLTPAMNL